MQAISRRRLALHIADELKAGVPVKKLARRVVAYLVEQKQTKQIELLIRDIEAALQAKNDVVTAHITSARELDEAVRRQLRDFVTSAESAKDVVIASETVDPELIGGVVVRTPSSVFDGSVRTKIRQLHAMTKE